MPPDLTEQQVARRRRYAQWWAVASVLWSLARSAVVWTALSDYGVDPLVYLCIDLGCAGVLAVTVPRLVTSLIDRRRRRAAAWAVGTLVFDVLPDVYIFFASDELPWIAITLVLAFVYTSVALGAVSIRRRVLAGRAARANAEAALLA